MAASFDPDDMAGYYKDTIHPNCQRIIEVAAPKATVSGTTGNPGCPADGSGRVWTLYGKVKGDALSVDFPPWEVRHRSRESTMPLQGQHPVGG